MLFSCALQDIKLGSSASEVNADGDEEEAGALTQARNKLVSKVGVMRGIARLCIFSC